MQIERIVNFIKNNKKPVLFLDTCSLLDIIRTTYRKDILCSNVNGFLSLLNLLEKKEFFSIITYLVQEEFRNNINNLSVELDRHCNKLLHLNDRFITILNALNIGYEFNLVKFENINLLKILTLKLNAFLEKSHIIDKDIQLLNKAHGRNSTKKAPSTQTKSELNDCINIEHYLNLAKNLRKENFDNNIYFITSNKNDYGDIGKLKPPLDVEFENTSIKYRNNFNWIFNDLEGR